MNVTYMVERWSTVWPELQPHWKNHWDEVALHHDRVPLDPDMEQYAMLDAMGRLSVLVARSAGKVIGYHMTIIRSHLHYKSTLHGFVDLYYIAPEFRQGMTGVRLFKEAVKELKRRGVVKVLSGTKLQISNKTGKSLDMSPVLERLGWQSTERLYSICLGD